MLNGPASILCGIPDMLIPEQNLEPEKCEGWQWWTVKQLRESYETDPNSLFLPMRNLFEQRPEMAEKLETGGFV